MATHAVPPYEIISGNTGDGTATHDTRRGHQATFQHPTYNTVVGRAQNKSIKSSSPGADGSNTKKCSESTGDHSRSRFQLVLQEETNQMRQACNLTTSSKPSTCKDIHYILCSENFDDIVLINPIDIDYCSLTTGYKVPTKSKVCNAYFKATKRICKTSTCKWLI